MTPKQELALRWFNAEIVVKDLVSKVRTGELSYAEAHRRVEIADFGLHRSRDEVMASIWRRVLG